MKNASTIILILLGLGGVAFIFFVFLKPALTGTAMGGGAVQPGGMAAVPMGTTQQLLANQGLAPVATAGGSTANLAITDASSLVSQLIANPSILSQ